MIRLLRPKLVWAYAVLCLVAALGYARYDSYMMDGDGTAFLDIAQALNTGHPGLAINAYWNPGYPAVLALAERLAHPDLWRELVVLRYANVLIFALALAGTLFFTRSLCLARSSTHPSAAWSLTPVALDLLGLATLIMSLGRELPIPAPRSDTLLLACLLFAGGLMLRCLRSGRLLHFALLGLALGTAYLTKSFAFLPAIAVILFFTVRVIRTSGSRRSLLSGTVLTAALFTAIAGPYIVAISRGMGHLTTGESARLNYAFFVDLTPRWHEWFHHDLGHATGPFLHPEAPLVSSPAVFSYAVHPAGTFPLWFDPAWYTLGLKPHLWPHGQILRMLRNVAMILRFLLDRPEVLVLLGILLAAGARLTNDTGAPRRLRWVWAPAAWGALMFAIYFPVDIQDRYVIAPFLLIVLSVFALLESRSQPHQAPSIIAPSLVLLFAAINLGQAVTFLAEHRRHIPPADLSHPGLDRQIFPAAAALHQIGVRPGENIACMGDQACYTDHYWARLLGARILAEVETAHEANPLDVWNGTPDKRIILDPLRSLGIRYLVSLFPNSASKPPGWVQLGATNFFAYPVGH